MANEHIIYSRIQLKNDSELNWNKKENFIPLQGEAIIYNTDDSHDYYKIKIGDGINNIKDIKFLSGPQIDWSINDEKSPSFIKNKPVFGEAAEKNIDEVTLNNNTNLPTSAAVINYFNDNKLQAGEGISLENKTILNTGVRNITTSNENGNIKVNIGGIEKNITIKGLDSAAYMKAEDFATKAQGLMAEQAMPKTGGTFTGAIILNQNPIVDLQAATKKYVDDNVNLSGTLVQGTQIGILTVNGISTTLFAPPPTTHTIAITQSAETPTFEFVESTNISTSPILTGMLSVNSLEDGKMILYFPKYTLPAQEQSVKFTFANETESSTYPLYISKNVRSKIQYPGGYPILLTYYDSAFYIVNLNNIVL